MNYQEEMQEEIGGEIIKLSKRDRILFFNALNFPIGPNNRLKKSMKRFLKEWQKNNQM